MPFIISVKPRVSAGGAVDMLLAWDDEAMENWFEVAVLMLEVMITPDGIIWDVPSPLPPPPSVMCWGLTSVGPEL
jgi:hypothetical protein